MFLHFTNLVFQRRHEVHLLLCIEKIEILGGLIQSYSRPSRRIGLVLTSVLLLSLVFASIVRPHSSRRRSSQYALMPLSRRYMMRCHLIPLPSRCPRPARHHCDAGPPNISDLVSCIDIKFKLHNTRFFTVLLDFVICFFLPR